MSPKSSKKRPKVKSQGKNPPFDSVKHAPSISGRSVSKASRRGASTRQNDDAQIKAAPKPPQGGYFLWGRHAVAAALANPNRRIAALYITDDSRDSFDALYQDLEANRQAELPDARPIERRRLDGIGGHDSEKAVHQGMAAAVWPLDAPHLDDFIADSADKPIRIIMLDQISDPRNVGAILRSARAFGCNAIITTHRNAPEENGALARTATGALEHIPIIRVVNLARAVESLQDHDITVAGLAGDGTMDVGALADFRRLAIMLGAEGPGLRRLSREHCDHLVRIDIAAEADSLNVSIAAAIALYAAKG
ncbi:23S rRNA (guanosine(2251)-2'-O)-methyltransferase RlmB [Candidatus Puniceispirillum sp.]|uniref:23S rRNA (guanosine(2251)-2'-O)-methyltransferase RlmB n=1 Tax=Candidatus Puniceispirillum sp. TaxID=2026719 RepID=UPI003F6A183E